MHTALWLLRVTPQWYASTLVDPFSDGPLTFIPALGMVCLLAGALLSLVRRERRALWFLIPFALSEALVAVAGALQGRVRGEPASIILYGLLIVQLALAGWLVWRLKGARMSALLLASFSLSYALFAAFVAGMAFANDWL